MPTMDSLADLGTPLTWEKVVTDLHKPLDMVI